MDFFSLDIVNQAFTNLFAGICFALINVIVRYFVPSAPRVITVLGWRRLKTAVIAAYLIALVVQVATSPYFRSAFTPVMVEFAWSPYQALFNVLGVVVMDLIVMAWSGARRGAEVGRKQFEVVKDRAADTLDDLGAHVPLSAEQREAQEARRQAREAAEAQSTSERKQRVDDRLKDY
jgi:hypothetical protein